MNKENASEIEDKNLIDGTKINAQRNVNCNEDEGIQIGERCRR